MILFDILIIYVSKWRAWK